LNPNHETKGALLAARMPPEHEYGLGLEARPHDSRRSTETLYSVCKIAAAAPSFSARWPALTGWRHKAPLGVSRLRTPNCDQTTGAGTPRPG
jgi:hypothetical protein